MSDVIVIGVAGGTGSGKTTLVKALVNRFGDNITVLSHDNYYKRHDELTYEERTKLNYDHPDAFDTDMMIEHLQQLREGHAIECPTYDYTIHNRAAETITIEPRKVIVVEGILIFASRVLCDQMDIKIFVDADADVGALVNGQQFQTGVQFFQLVGGEDTCLAAAENHNVKAFSHGDAPSGFYVKFCRNQGNILLFLSFSPPNSIPDEAFSRKP